MSDPNTYCMTSGEIDLCWNFAKKVAATYETPEKRFSGELTVDAQARTKRERTFWFSRCSEWAVCRLLGINPATELSWKLSIDDGHDLIYRDRFIDVKTSKAPNPRLIFPVTKAQWVEECDIDYLCLTYAVVPHVTIIGFVSIAEFIKRKRVSVGADGFKPGTLWMPAGELTSLGEFVSSLA
jgi:hypothetical protein